MTWASASKAASTAGPIQTASAVWAPAPLAMAQRAAGDTLNMTDLLDGAVSTRFYRVVLLP